MSGKPNFSSLISLKINRRIPEVSASFSRRRSIRPAAPSNRVYETRMLNVESRLGAVEAFLPAAPAIRGRRRVINRNATISVSEILRPTNIVVINLLLLVDRHTFTMPLMKRRLPATCLTLTAPCFSNLNSF